jgi:hypothetical protein
MIYNYCINYRKLEASFTVSLLWKMKTTMASFRLLLQKWHLWPIYKNWFHIVNFVSRENFILGLSTHNIFEKRASYASSKSIQVVRQNILKIRENFVHRCMPMSTLLTKPLFKTLTGIVFPCAFFLLLNCDKTSYIKNSEMVHVITQIELVSYVSFSVSHHVMRKGLYINVNNIYFLLSPWSNVVCFNSQTGNI